MTDTECPQQQSANEPTLDNLLWDSIASAIDKENIKIFSDKPNNDGKIPKYIDSKFTKQLTKKIEQQLASTNEAKMPNEDIYKLSYPQANVSTGSTPLNDLLASNRELKALQEKEL